MGGWGSGKKGPGGRAGALRYVRGEGAGLRAGGVYTCVYIEMASPSEGRELGPWEG